MSEKKSQAELLKEELFMEQKHTADIIDEKEAAEAFEFCEGYKNFLTACRPSMT